MRLDWLGHLVLTHILNIWGLWFFFQWALCVYVSECPTNISAPHMITIVLVDSDLIDTVCGVEDEGGCV